MNQESPSILDSLQQETLVMTKWPSVAATPWGRLLGRVLAIQQPGLYIFTPGNLFALPAIPVAIVLYFYRVLPVIAQRYCLTNRRIVIQKGLTAVDHQSIGLDAFDTIQIDVQPGQAWFHAGDLVFLADGTERFRLPGVPRPEAFRRTCLKARAAYLGVREVLERQAASAEPTEAEATAS